MSTGNVAKSLLLLALAFSAAQPLEARRYRVLHTFKNDITGGYPGPLILDPAGNLLGTTASGGTLFTGTVFRLAKDGAFTTIYTFPGVPNGVDPSGALLLDGTGDIYGTTTYGGSAAYCGTVYKLESTGVETVFYSFAGSPDAANPYEGVVRDPAGNLFGTTTYGGTVDAGTVFKVDPAGNETVLYSFGNSPAGQYPQGPVILDSAGNLYGAVQDGAAGGSVFKIDSTGNFAVLYTFKGVPDGSTPSGALVQDRVGNLYGTTYLGGAFGLGTIFQLDKHGRETVLHSFAGGRDGANPLGGVIRDSSGDLYGTTLGGGISDLGTIYKLDKTGHETILHSFTGGARGEAPGVGVVRDSVGNLYGTTNRGGTYGLGIVFVLTP
jgi:uncharacterized repeat protein (TIGR03803 family)